MFSQTAEYALRAMTWLAMNPGRLVPTASIAQKTGVPSHYLAKVLQQLAVAELIDGRRGVRGGYKLSRPAHEITLLDVIRAVSTFERRGQQSQEASPELQPLDEKIEEAAAAMIRVFRSATLGDLMKDAENSSNPAPVQSS